jgi:hypothetical protein
MDASQKNAASVILREDSALDNGGQHHSVLDDVLPVISQHSPKKADHDTGYVHNAIAKSAGAHNRSACWYGAPIIVTAACAVGRPKHKSLRLHVGSGRAIGEWRILRPGGHSLARPLANRHGGVQLQQRDGELWNAGPRKQAAATLSEVPRL